MRKLVAVVVFALAVSGCYVRGGLGFRGPNPLAVIATAVAVNAVVNAVAYAPPVVANVEYYDYGHNPGNVWVNGRYQYVNNSWAWQGGYWQPERSGHYWVQGAWTPRGNQHVWVDGYWAAPRQGYTYIDGYWDDRGNGYAWSPGRWEVERPGHVYIGGSWATVGGRRTWNQGRWQQDDGRVEWTRYRARGRASVNVNVNVNVGPTVRDHRR